ncbi:nitroreductase/quinone reductase family protein [Modestobacter sp. SSW1-42]|uniref:nitroreductase/quinone reductase family protein n=1 Tax=Modestobacter sp. SSW1-42 TaxID=596372 RepID=UPI003985A765
MSTFNDKIIAEFRANGGRVDSAGFGTNLVLLHTRGAKTGTARVNPAMSLRDGDDWLVVASAMGAAKDPAWAVNLRAHPEVEIEVATDFGVETVPVTAVELDGDEYDAAFARFVRRSSAFATYQQRATERRLPVIRLSRRSTESSPSVGIGVDDPDRELVHARPDDEHLSHYGVVGDNYTVLIRGEDTNGRYALIDMFVPPGGGPPPHRHDFEEMFHVLEGEFEVTFRGEKSVVRAGETINVPARAPHFFHNASGRDARVLCMVSPPGLEEYFTLWGLPLPTRTTPPQLSDEEARSRLRQAIHLGPRYAIENLTGAD